MYNFFYCWLNQAFITMSDSVFCEKACLVGIFCEEANQIQNRLSGGVWKGHEQSHQSTQRDSSQQGVLLYRRAQNLEGSGIWIAKEQQEKAARSTRICTTIPYRKKAVTWCYWLGRNQRPERS